MIPEDAEFKLHLLATIKSWAEILRGVRYQSSREGISHSAIVSHATYSPWLDDREFQAVWPTIAPNTLLDVYRMYQLWGLAGQVCEDDHGAADILEVGSWRGGSGCLIAHRARLCDADSRIYLADTFTGVAKTGERDTLYRGGEHGDTSEGAVRELIDGLMLRNVTLLKGLFPEETATPITDRLFRLCHIDVDAYQSGRDVFDWVWPRLVRGGIVVFDDFGFWGCEGITSLVQEIRQAPDRVFIHNLTGQAILIKT